MAEPVFGRYEAVKRVCEGIPRRPPWRVRVWRRAPFRLRVWAAVAAYWYHERLPWLVAWALPRKVALLAFVRVYAVLGECGDDYEQAYRRWEKGEGK